jgi:hypothetical protein
MNAIIRGIRPQLTAYDLKDTSAEKGDVAFKRHGALWTLMESCWKHVAAERPSTKEIMSKVRVCGTLPYSRDG